MDRAEIGKPLTLQFIKRNAGEDGDPGHRQATRAAGRRPEEFLSGRLSAGSVAW
jgi:hypothetical protein